MFRQSKNITINSRKYDGKTHRSWSAELLEKDNSLLKLLGKFEKEITHQHLGVIRRATVSYEYYWLDRWYNVFSFYEPEGDFRNYYCNINLPPTFDNDILDYVDLDVDILIWKDYSFSILDLDEFEENARIYNYSKEIIIKTKETLSILIDRIERRKFPFNFQNQPTKI